jgi:preprotein translocase subunit YajC
MQTVFLLLAQAQDNGKAGEPAWGPMIPLLLLGLVFYFLLLRPGMRQEKERKALRSALKKDDRILTTSGIYGVVVSVSEKEDEVVVRVADNVRLRMVKAAVDRNFTNEEAAREAKGKPASSDTSITSTPRNE